MLKTVRTVMEPLHQNDVDEILAMYQEPDSNKFIAPLLNKSEAYYRNFLANKIQKNEHTVGFWTVRNAATGEFIGTTNLNQFKESEMMHIGCHLRTKYWNQGYAFELLQALLEHGFNSLHLQAIHGVFDWDNVVSKKLMLKLGFTPYQELEEDGKLLYIYRKEAASK